MTQPTGESVEIANFEGPEVYHSLRVVLQDDGSYNVVLWSGPDKHQQTILDGVGRWYSSAEHWEDLTE